MELPANPGFLPAFGAVTFFADLVTALILFSQAQALRDRRTALLGSAYLMSVLAIVPHLLTFPGVFAERPLFGGSASAVWLWCAWHSGFALCICRYALAKEPEQDRRIRLVPLVAGTAAAVLALTAVATAGLPWLPVILVGGSFAALNALGIGPFVVACNVAALLLVARRVRSGGFMAAWLAVAVLAATLDTVLTLRGAGRFTLGWYAARCLSMTTGLVVLAALLFELTSLFRRTVQANRRLEQISLTDPLTGISNRRAFDQALATEWRRARRERIPLSLLLLDIDLFKGFNDRYGHPAGDDCLRRIAQALMAESNRAGDVIARIGGEEFAILLPAVEEAEALQTAEAVHARVAELGIEHGASAFGRVSVSIGVATSHGPLGTAEAATLIETADQALYAAKASGRNRSCQASELDNAIGLLAACPGHRAKTTVELA